MSSEQERSREARVSPRTEGKRKRGLGIQWRLLAYLTVFVLFILLVLWVFQVQMLDSIYENMKEQELEQTATALSLALGDDEETKDAVYTYASQYSICICVYRVDRMTATPTGVACVSGSCIIHHLPGEYLGALYELAVDNEGSYTGKVSFRTGRGMVILDENKRLHTDGIVGEIPPFAEDIPADQEPRMDEVSALHIQQAEGTDGERYIIMLDAGLTPMSATVSTLKTQFLWITVILLSGALLLAYLMSRRISRPLVRMNESARALADGRYDVQFVGKGYRETRELATTLNYAAAELSKTDKLQKELVANVSHDLRTPLTMIRGYSEVMRDLPGENTPENMQVIIDETDRLSELVSDLLDLSRLRSGTQPPQLEVFDLTETVRSVLLRYEKLTHHDGYTITFAADEDACIYADRTMVLQVVYNLINNAINYAGEDRRVEVTQTIADGRVRIGVRDYGEGIEPDQLALIWDRYYKVDRVHRRARVGTGLGLSIAKGVLELHGADYGVNSVPSEGSEFWFAFAVEADETDEQGE